MTEAVPGIEGEYPCTSRRPVIRKISKGAAWCCGHGGTAIIGSLVDAAIPLGGYGSLHPLSSL